MEAPNRVNWSGYFPDGEVCPQYIRADLVDKLIDKHTIHSGGCPAHKDGTCTCGLTDIIAQIRGGK